MANSSAVVAGTAGLISQYNALRNDVLDNATGHDHSGSFEHGKYCGGIPIGGIIIWSGSIASIPANYLICDGTNGTPDLREKFVICAGDSYAVNATGGAATKNLSHTHSTTGITVTNESTHTHAGGSVVLAWTGAHTHQAVFGAGAEVQSGSEYNIFAESTGAHAHTVPTGASAAGGAHTHTLSGATASGGSTTQDIMPPWYALALIQRVT